MTTDFRALCAELVDELNYHADEHSVDELMQRARIALATSPPEPPVAEGVPHWSEGICGDGAAILRDGVMTPIEEVIAELNRRPPPKPPEPLTNMEIAAWADADSYVPNEEMDGDWFSDSYSYRRCFTKEEFGRTIRAALERWGHA